MSTPSCALPYHEASQYLCSRPSWHFFLLSGSGIRGAGGIHSTLTRVRAAAIAVTMPSTQRNARKRPVCERMRRRDLYKAMRRPLR